MGCIITFPCSSVISFIRRGLWNSFGFFFLMAAVSFDLTAQVSPFLDAHLVVPLLDFLLEKEVGEGTGLTLGAGTNRGRKDLFSWLSDAGHALAASDQDSSPLWDRS